jgi:hypothetical protein
MVTDTGFGMQDHSLIPATAIGKEMEPLDVRTDPRTRLNGTVGQILVVKNNKIRNTCKFRK